MSNKIPTNTLRLAAIIKAQANRLYSFHSSNLKDGIADYSEELEILKNISDIVDCLGFKLFNSNKSCH